MRSTWAVMCEAVHQHASPGASPLDSSAVAQLTQVLGRFLETSDTTIDSGARTHTFKRRIV